MGNARSPVNKIDELWVLEYWDCRASPRPLCSTAWLFYCSGWQKKNEAILVSVYETWYPGYVTKKVPALWNLNFYSLWISAHIIYHRKSPWRICGVWCHIHDCWWPTCPEAFIIITGNSTHVNQDSTLPTFLEYVECKHKTLCTKACRMHTGPSLY